MNRFCVSALRLQRFPPGGLQVVADLIHLDQDMYGMQNDPINMALRRYAGMALTNLTFGDVVNKVEPLRRDVEELKVHL